MEQHTIYIYRKISETKLPMLYASVNTTQVLKAATDWNILKAGHPCKKTQHV